VQWWKEGCLWTHCADPKTKKYPFPLFRWRGAGRSR